MFDRFKAFLNNLIGKDSRAKLIEISLPEPEALIVLPDRESVVSDRVEENHAPVDKGESIRVYGPETLDNLLLRHKAFYIHAKNALFERYAISLEPNVWKLWNKAIKAQSEHAVYLEEKNGSTLWRVWLDNRVVFVAFREDCVITCLTPSPRLQSLVNRALKERRIAWDAQHKDNKKLQTKAQGNHVEKKLNITAKLPPKHKRPQRNEKALLALKQKALGVYEDDEEEMKVKF